MRTTLDIDEDILIYAKGVARNRGVSAGKVVSELARSALTTPMTTTLVNGVPVFPRRPGGPVITLELVNELRDEE